jgi:hypothetical protein
MGKKKNLNNIKKVFVIFINLTKQENYLMILKDIEQKN